MPLIPFDLPAGLVGLPERDGTWRPWLERLPRLVRDVVEEWSLTFDGAPRHGQCALVVPVRTDGGTPAALKLAWPHDESQHEHLLLQAVGGDGMVRLLRADPRRGVLLLERLHETDLRSVDDVEACEVVAGLYARIQVPALPALRTLTSYVERWTANLEALPRDAPLPRRLVEQAVSLAGSLVTDPQSASVSLHGDLHYENVLAADREPWLVIDPKPMAGDRHYEVAPMLWNRWDEVVGPGDVRSAVRRRFHALVDTAMLDEDRARDWVVVREVHNALWAIEDAQREDRRLDAEDREWLTRCVAIAKAVQE